jgi:Flp pilus assembly protein TadG
MREAMGDRSLAALRRRKGKGNAGNVAVEFALTAPLLVGLVIGGADYSIMANNQEVLEAATRAGAEYGRANYLTDAPSWPNTKLYVTGYMSFSSPVTASASTVYTCVDGTNAGSTLAAATTFCNSHQSADPRVLQYVSVTATQNFSALLAWSAFGFPSSLTATTVARFQ